MYMWSNYVKFVSVNNYRRTAVIRIVKRVPGNGLRKGNFNLAKFNFCGKDIKGVNLFTKGWFSFKRGKRGKIHEEIYPTIM